MPYIKPTFTNRVSAREMLEAIAYRSDNDLYTYIARRVLLGTTSIAKELGKKPNPFFTAVLKGCFDTALHLANEKHKKILLDMTETTTQDGETVREGQIIWYVAEGEVHSASYSYGYHNRLYQIFYQRHKAEEFLQPEKTELV